MVKLNLLKNDWKQIIREPLMVLLFLSPVLISVMIRLITVFIVPLIFHNFNLDLTRFMPYPLIMTLIICPLMLGIVMGFMMMEDKDSKIMDLMSITPLSKQGYIANRLFFIVGATVLHTILTYIIMGRFIFTWVTFLLTLALLCLFAILVGLVFFSLATDKINGLTYAKGLSLIMIFAFADLLKGNAFKLISLGFPTYWLAEIVKNPQPMQTYLYGFVSCLFWLGVILRLGKFKVYN